MSGIRRIVEGLELTVDLQIMLQQTQVVTVKAYFARWMKRFPTVAALAASSQDDVHEAWKGLGCVTIIIQSLLELIILLLQLLLASNATSCGCEDRHARL